MPVPSITIITSKRWITCPCVCVSRSLSPNLDATQPRTNTPPAGQQVGLPRCHLKSCYSSCLERRGSMISLYDWHRPLFGVATAVKATDSLSVVINSSWLQFKAARPQTTFIEPSNSSSLIVQSIAYVTCLSSRHSSLIDASIGEIIIMARRALFVALSRGVEWGWLAELADRWGGGLFAQLWWLTRIVIDGRCGWLCRSLNGLLGTSTI